MAKLTYANYPENQIEVIKEGLCRALYNIEEKQEVLSQFDEDGKELEPTILTVYECDFVELAEPVTYEKLTEALIAKEYSFGAELALERQKESKPEEWGCYNTYCEECKAIAKEILRIN